MNPKNWFRWRVLAVLAGLFYFFALDPLAHSSVNDLGAGESKSGARWYVEDLILGLLTGTFDLEGVEVATPRGSEANETTERVFSAERVVIDFDMGQILRKRLHGDFELRMPKLTIERRPDGTTNIHDLGDEEAEPPAASEEDPRDWVEAIGEWFEKLKTWEKRTRTIRERIARRREGKPVEKDAGAKVDTSRRVTYPYDRVTRYVARSVAGTGLEIQFLDRASESAEAFPALTDGTIRIENVSEKPFVHEEPIRWSLSGNLAGAKVEISGDLDLKDIVGASGDWSVLNVKAKIEGLPLRLVEFFTSASLPVQFESGTLNFETDLTFWNFDRLSITPELSFVDAVMKPRPGVTTIAGFEAKKVCRIFNEVGTLELNDMAVRGTFAKPQIEVGATFKNLIASGARAFVSKQVQKGRDKAARRIEKEAGRVLEKTGGSKVLDESVKSGVRALRGLLGGGDEKDGKKE